MPAIVTARGLAPPKARAAEARARAKQAKKRAKTPPAKKRAPKSKGNVRSLIVSVLSAPRGATTEQQRDLTLASARAEIRDAVRGRWYWMPGAVPRARADFRTPLSMETLAERLSRVAPARIDTFGGARVHLAAVMVDRSYYPLSLAASRPEDTVLDATIQLLEGISRYAVAVGMGDDGDAPRAKRRKRKTPRPPREKRPRGKWKVRP